jgi:hypothetical protein
LMSLPSYAVISSPGGVVRAVPLLWTCIIAESVCYIVSSSAYETRKDGPAIAQTIILVTSVAPRRSVGIVNISPVVNATTEKASTLSTTRVERALACLAE